MDPATRQLIEALHHSPLKCVLVLAGGGTGALARLLEVPGGSRTLLEASVPYSEEAFAEFLGQKPAQFCSAETSRLMAQRAAERGRWLALGQPVLGLGCTATLTTDRPKRGDHRFHLSISTDTATVTHSLTLQKGARDRAAEEAIVDAVLLNALAEACGIPDRLAVPLLPDEVVETDRLPASDPLATLLEGSCGAVCIERDGRVRRGTPRPGAVLPGSFNPVHHGHWQLAAVAARRTGLPVAFELSMANVDKPPLPLAEVRRRAAQFTWSAPLWITCAPTFAEKAVLFPGTVFVVGADTAERIVDPRYYQDQPELMMAALEQIQRQGCRVLVAGREDSSGRFVAGQDLAVPAPFGELFEAIPEAEFHVAISSTQLRERSAAGSH